MSGSRIPLRDAAHDARAHDGRHPIWQLADDVQKDLRSATARLVALRAQLAAMELAGQPLRMTCPDCGVTVSGPRTLSEHRYHSHNGPEPAHWLDLERRIAQEDQQGATG